MTQKRLFVLVEFENGGERRSTSSRTNTTFTARKVMFLHLSVILFTAVVGGALCWGDPQTDPPIR